MFQSILDFFKNHSQFGNFSTSLLLLGGLMLFRWVAVYRIRQWNLRSLELRRKWMVQVRNWSVLLFFLGLVIIWASEIRTIALSVAAIAVAFVIATKELITCFAGSFLKASTQAFQLGDRIRIQECRGDVIDQNLISTRILEVGPHPNGIQYTGNVVTIPNSLFTMYPVTNETLSPHVCMHTFEVSLSRDKDRNWQLAEGILLAATERVCKQYLPEAKKAMDSLARHTALDTPSVEPRVSVAYTHEKELKLTVRVACLPKNRWKIEQAILRSFKRRFFTEIDEAPKEEPLPTL